MRADDEFGGVLRVAFADPPYLGQGVKHYGDRHEDAGVYDTLDGHRALVDRLVSEFPDGWAMSLHAPSLRHILPLCPADCRLGAWVKPFCSYKPNVNPAYTWEPVVWRGGRKFDRWSRKVRDHVACNVTLRAGFPGAKPDGFSFWLFDLLNLTPEDEFVDLFPGSGAVGRAWRRWRRMHDGLFPTPGVGGVG